MRSLAFLHKDGDPAPPGRSPDSGEVSSIYIYHIQVYLNRNKKYSFWLKKYKNYEKTIFTLQDEF